MVAFRTVVLILLLFLGIYLSIASIIALPLLDEDTLLEQNDKFNFKTQVDSIKVNTDNYLDNLIKLDQTTINSYTRVCDSLKISSDGSSIDVTVDVRKRNIIEQVNDISRRLKASYDLIGAVGKFAKHHYCQTQLDKFSNYCDTIKYEGYIYLYSVRSQLTNLLVIAKNDNSTNRQETTKEFKILKESLRPFVGHSFNIGFPPEDKSSGIFYQASMWALSAESQNLAIITGLIGFAIFGSVLGAMNVKNDNSVQALNVESIWVASYNLIVVLIRGFAAAVVVYLSIKAGLSLVSISSETKLNPYVILFLCFIAAVYSDDIWVWAKTKLVSSNTKQ